MSIETMSITETAKVYGTSRQNIIKHIHKGNMHAQHGKERKRDWRVSPAGVIELTRNQYNNFLASIGIYLFAHTLYENNIISDEEFETAKNACRETLNTAYSIDVLIPLIDNMAANFPFIKELLNSTAA